MITWLAMTRQDSFTEHQVKQASDPALTDEEMVGLYRSVQNSWTSGAVKEVLFARPNAFSVLHRALRDVHATSDGALLARLAPDYPSSIFESERYGFEELLHLHVVRAVKGAVCGRREFHGFFDDYAAVVFVTSGDPPCRLHVTYSMLRPLPTGALEAATTHLRAVRQLEAATKLTLLSQENNPWQQILPA